jgi:hypothetical protein
MEVPTDQRSAQAEQQNAQGSHRSAASAAVGSTSLRSTAWVGGRASSGHYTAGCGIRRFLRHIRDTQIRSECGFAKTLQVVAPIVVGVDAMLHNVDVRQVGEQFIRNLVCCERAFIRDVSGRVRDRHPVEGQTTLGRSVSTRGQR